jgi:undecaprenyl-diphosphatase
MAVLVFPMSRDLDRGAERFLDRPARAAAVGAGLLVLVLIFAIVIPANPLAIDDKWARAMHHVVNGIRTEFALVCNWLGKGLGVVLVLGALGAVLAVRRRWAALTVFAAAEAFDAIVTAGLKVIVARPRPPGGEVATGSLSFPSGHTAYCAVTSIAIVLVFTKPGRRAVAWTLAVLAIATMAWSRTYLEVHWLSDVVAGALLGVGTAFLVFGAGQMLMPRLAAEAGRGESG